MNYYEVGRIVNTHGLQGELKIYASSDFQKERFAKGATLALFDQSDNYVQNLTVARSKALKSSVWLLKFKEYDSINDVEKYKEYFLKISEDQLTDLPENEFYYHEIIGLDVYEKEAKIGSISEILQPGANDVWVVKRQGRRDLLLPYIASVVLSVNLETKKVLVDIPEGLDED